jgi:hypothetical protein
MQARNDHIKIGVIYLTIFIWILSLNDLDKVGLGKCDVSASWQQIDPRHAARSSVNEQCEVAE